jgi:membrane fusion protein, multidrug efflux system
MKKYRTIVLVALFAAAAVAQQSVDVVRVVSKTVERKLTLPGEIFSYLTVDLHARVNGFVDKVNVDRGSIVTEGQILVTLVAPELAAQVAEAESKVRSVESLQSEAQAKLISAKSNYQGLKEAAATPGAVAANELVAAEQTMEANRLQIQSLEGSVRAARAAVQALKDLEAYLKITAPFDGVVTTRFVHPGALVGPVTASSAMVRIEQNTRLRLVVSVPEASVGGIVNGARVQFTVPAYPGETFFGMVARVAHSLDLKTRTMPVELDVLNPNLRLAPGMYAETQWPVRHPRVSLLVPPTSIVTTNERQFVVRVNGGIAEWVNVTRSATVGEMVEVLGPLNAGDLVVRRGSDEIREGVRLQVRQGAQ